LNSPDSESVLTVENLSIVFRQEGEERTTADRISFRLRRGAALGIVGESGSGKSITSLALMGLLPPGGRVAGGSARFQLPDSGPTDLLQLPEKEMRKLRGKRISMIFQEPMTSLNPSQRCGRQVTENIREHESISYSDARNRTLELFREVQLPDPERVYNAYPHQVSGGQKQRIMIAMALACRPDILIADEPTTALDVTVQKTILELLRNLQEKYGISLIFISHNLDVIAEIASEVLVMYRGKIVEQGSTETLFLHPEHPYTKGLLACRPPLGKRPLRLRVISDFTEGSLPPPEILIPEKDRHIQQQQLWSGDPLLRVDRLTTAFVRKRSFGGKPRILHTAVNQVSFHIFGGETMGLVGESGCGKTTLGRSLLRLTEPDAGNIFFRETEVTRLPAHELRKLRKKMQIIFQDPYSSLNPRITAGEAILEPMKVHRLHGSEHTRRQRVMDLLNRVGLESSHYNRYPHEFSGGQRQRICIARALAVEPEFIVCDESVSALDVSVQAQVLNLLNDLKKEFGLTYLFISHDLSVVRYMSDRLMVMQNGIIQESGEADAVYNQPQSDYTRKLLAAIPKGIG
jgi:peptide/nickel transport system ATP-binding protein